MTRAHILFFWLFDFNHISEHNQTYRSTIPCAITHTLLRSHSHGIAQLSLSYPVCMLRTEQYTWVLHVSTVERERVSLFIVARART